MIEQAPFLAVVDGAFDRYVARAPLYIATAAFIAALGSGIIYAARLDEAEITVLALALIAPLHGLVAMGTAVKPGDQKPAISDLFGRIFLRWPELLCCQLLIACIASLAVFSLLDNHLVSAIAMLPLTIAWGAISLSDVVVSLDDPAPAKNILESFVYRVKFFGQAVIESITYAFRADSITRVSILAIVQLPCMMLQMLIAHQSEIRHLGLSPAWTAFLISCVFDGIYESIFTSTLQRFRAA